MASVKMGKQGRIVIPAEIRNRLDFSEGDEFNARVEDGRLILESAPTALAMIRRKLAEGAGPRCLADELIDRRRSEARLEELKLERNAGNP
jgi:AbrB family looped-hinge helix DNA binding protein